MLKETTCHRKKNQSFVISGPPGQWTMARSEQLLGLLQGVAQQLFADSPAADTELAAELYPDNPARACCPHRTKNEEKLKDKKGMRDHECNLKDEQGK